MPAPTDPYYTPSHWQALQSAGSSTGPPAASTALLEDLTAHISVPSLAPPPAGPAANVGLMIGRAGGTKIMSCALAWLTGAPPLDAANYWTFALQRYRDGVLIGTIATKSTQSAGATPATEAITALKAWTFDSAAFDATHRKLRFGELLVLNIAPTGAPVAVTGLQASVRWEHI